MNYSNFDCTIRSRSMPMCTGVPLLTTNAPSNMQGMDLMVLGMRAGLPGRGGQLVLLHLEDSTAAAQPTLTLVSKVRCYPLLSAPVTVSTPAPAPPLAMVIRQRRGVFDWILASFSAASTVCFFTWP